jgi:putative endonuclease
MRGLDPRICQPANENMASWVYIVTNRIRGVLYTGVTADLLRRAFEHRHGLVQGFTKRYGLTQLVYYEEHAEILAAIQREKNIKHWPRGWKIQLIERMNPDWLDLYPALNE